MNKKCIITMMLALVVMTGQAQEERIDTVIPKFLSNGYFFREMPQLPNGEKTMSRLKDKEGNSVTVINVNATLPKSLIRKAIPREQVHNADQFLNGLNMMATVTSLTQAGVKADGTWYSPKEGNDVTYSRHITAHDRIIYDIYDNLVTVLIVQAEEHYNDK